jgi:hypothetical protein
MGADAVVAQGFVDHQPPERGWWTRDAIVDDWEGIVLDERRMREEAQMRVLDAIRDERRRQTEKHGDESCESPAVTDAKRLAILGEEFGEVCRAMTYDEGSEERLVAELVQVAAVAVAWIESRARA